MNCCPCCGQPLPEEASRERIRWYVPDDGRTLKSALGEKLLDSLRMHGQAVYVSADGGKTLRRVGVAAAPDGERVPTEEREPIILTPQEFARDWRPAGRPPKPPLKAMSAGRGGAR